MIIMEGIMQEIYLAGGCLWGVQAFVKTLPGVIKTEAGRANGKTTTLEGPYDGYVECVKTLFDPDKVSVADLVAYLFEVIDPYSLNKQGIDEGPKYRTGVYSKDPNHLDQARNYINSREDAERVQVEVLDLSNYIPSAEEHQDRLARCPDDYCHISEDLLTKYVETK